MSLVGVRHSLLRYLIPLYATGSGPYSWLLRHSFLHDQENKLVTMLLQSIEQAHLPLYPRMLFAEGFQRLLEEDSPQREIREFFETASMECRRALSKTDEINAVNRFTKYREAIPTAATAQQYNSSSSNNNNNNNKSIGNTNSNSKSCEYSFEYLPYERLLMYELIVASEYYANALAISSTPLISAAVLLRARIVSDLFRDTLLRCCFLEFEQLSRDEWTGKRKEELHGSIALAVKELLLLERDVFGVHRFDPRNGELRYLLYNIRLKDIASNQRKFSIVLDPLITEYGNFTLTNRLVNSNHWREYTLLCNEHEEHRLLPSQLPTHETLIVRDELLDKPTEMLIYYNQPICHYRQERDEFVPIGDVRYAEVFELAEPDQNRTWWERWFLDR